MSWQPIADLPDNWQDLASSEVDSLARAWEQTYQELKDTPMLRQFNERLVRSWSIETGIIERLYTIDRGVTQILIEQGIDTALVPHGATDKPPSEVIAIIRDQRDALEGIFAFVNQKQLLTLHYIRSLHQVLTRNQHETEALDQFGNSMSVSLIKGDWKQVPNNPRRQDGVMHVYCPPEQVQSEMERLIAMHNQHEPVGVSPQVEAAWLHHRFTQIHPFQDGNGRVARCLATMVLIRAGRFPLVIDRDQRMNYIQALEKVDSGDLSFLVRLFDQIEKRAYIQALDLSEDVLRIKIPVIDVIDSIAQKYQERQHQLYSRVFEVVARRLWIIAFEDLESYRDGMQQVFQMNSLNINVRVDRNSHNNSNWYRIQIIDTARKLGYFANLTRPRLWVRLRMSDSIDMLHSNAEIIVTFHYLGKENRGAMVASAFLDIVHRSTSQEEEDTTFRETHVIVDDVFAFAYNDQLHTRMEAEFRSWLEQAVAVGLAEWQKQL